MEMIDAIEVDNVEYGLNVKSSQLPLIVEFEDEEGTSLQDALYSSTYYCTTPSSSEKKIYVKVAELSDTNGYLIVAAKFDYDTAAANVYTTNIEDAEAICLIPYVDGYNLASIFEEATHDGGSGDSGETGPT